MPADEDDDDDIEQAILAALPTTPHQNDPNLHDRPAFDLARQFKAITRLADAPADVLRPHVRRFHHLAQEVRQKPWEETWADFRRAWKNVRFPAGAGTLEQAFARARFAVTPGAAAIEYEQPELHLLVRLCRELQRASGPRPFFLSCHTAGRLLAVDHTKAWRWLGVLVDDHWLTIVEKPTPRKATRYRYRDVGNRELWSGLN